MALEEEDMSLTLAGKLSRNVYVLGGRRNSAGAQGLGGWEGPADPPPLPTLAAEILSV